MDDSGTILVRDLMAAKPVSIAPDARVREAILLMTEQEVGSVVIVDDDALVGIFTERDVLRGSAAAEPGWRDRAVAELMTPDPFSVSPGERWDDAMDRMSARGVRHLPVVEGGSVIGMLAMRDIGNHRTGVLETLVRERTTELHARNEELARRDRERSQTLAVAARIQRQLLPAAPPSRPPFHVAVHFEPCDEVAGDYWDCQEFGPDDLGLVLADVSGHGVPAAFAAAMAKTTYALRCRGTREPGAVLLEMNALLSDLLQEQFVTMLAARLDRRGPGLVFARAGHPPPLLYRPGEGVRELDSDGMMLGVDPGAEFPEVCVGLAPGDRVLLYTDGLTESRDEGGELLGTASLSDTLVRHGDGTAEEVLSALVATSKRHLGSLQFEDDVTAMVVAVQAEG